MTEKFHLTPPARASARPVGQLATGSFQSGMMGCGAFISLKAAGWQRESAKQPEIRLAILLKILRI